MKKILLTLIAIALSVVIFTYPSVFHLTDKIIGDGGDNYQFLSFQYLANQQFINGQFPFGWTNYWRYPAGFDLSTSYDSTLLLLSGIGMYQFIQSPVLVYNVSIFLFLGMNIGFSYLFFRKITGNSLIGFIGGILYGVSFYNLARAGGHPNLLMTGWVPLVAYSFLYCKEKQASTRSIALLFTSFTMVYLTSLQYFLLMLGAALFIVPISFILMKEKVSEMVQLLLMKRKEVLIAGVVFLAIFYFFNSVKIHSYFSGSLILPTPEIVSVPLTNYFLPNIYIKTPVSLFANNTKEWIEFAVFLGFIEIIAVIGMLVSKKIDRGLKVIISILTSLFLILGLGGGKEIGFFLPYDVLFHVLPFRGIIEPGRFYIISYFFIVTAIVFFLKTLLSRKNGKTFIVIFFLLACVERLPVNFYLSETLSDQDFIPTVQGATSQAVLDLPVFTDWWNGNRYDLYSIYYKKAIVNGYIHWSGNTKETQVFLNKLDRFICSNDKSFTPHEFTQEVVSQERRKNEDLIERLRAYEIRTIVIHKDLSQQENGCLEVNDRIKIFTSQFEGQLQKTFEDADKIVYQVL